MEKVPASGYKIKGLWISGIQRRLTLDNLSFPLKLISSVWKSKSIVRKFKPDVVIGTGGFASGPVLYVAAGKKIPSLIQEQNSYPGITNKLLSKKVNSICVAYDQLERFFPAEKIIKTGNPVRQDLLSIAEKRKEALSFFGLQDGQKTLLILGGSLGARRVNELIADNIKWLVAEGVKIIWQTGKLYIEKYKNFNELEGVQVHAFLNRMDLVYAAADFIISRAGASSISELCIVGKPTVFIPSPNVSEDHQTKNALSVVSNDGGMLIREAELDVFKASFLELLNNKDLQKRYSENIKKLALPNATIDIVNEIEKIIKK